MLPGGAGAGGALRFLTSESQLAAQRALATHPEGNDVIFDPGLDHLDDRTRSRTSGDNISDCFDRMGDPFADPPPRASRQLPMQ